MALPKPWINPVHTLLYPVDLPEGGRLESVEVRPFNVGEHRAALAKAGKDEDARYEALALLATGLDVAALEELKRTDYISLQVLIQEYIGLPATYFQELDRESADFDPDDVPLLIPIKGIGRTIDRVAIEPPSLKVSKGMRKLKTDDERADFCTSACTGIPVEVLNRMSIPDWTQLQGRLDDFLNKPATYFQPTTSK